MLNKREEEVLKSIIDYIGTNGYPPSVREVGEAIGLKSSSNVHFYFNSLEQKGYIEKKKGIPRAIKVLKEVHSRDK